MKPLGRLSDWFIELTDDDGCRVGGKCREGEQLRSRGEEEEESCMKKCPDWFMMDVNGSRDGCVGLLASSLFRWCLFTHAVCERAGRIVGKDCGSVSGLRGSQFMCTCLQLNQVKFRASQSVQTVYL